MHTIAASARSAHLLRHATPGIYDNAALLTTEPRPATSRGLPTPPADWQILPDDQPRSVGYRSATISARLTWHDECDVALPLPRVAWITLGSQRVAVHHNPTSLECEAVWTADMRMHRLTARTGLGQFMELLLTLAWP